MILVVDNYDSFTYNLVQYLGQCGADVVVARNDEISISAVLEQQPDGILLSPGPKSPAHSAVCLEVLQSGLDPDGPFRDTPIFGVCLGHQAMGHAGGGVVRQAERARHGKTSAISHDGRGVFTGLANPFQAVRYHSLVIDPSGIPKGFEVTAHSTDDNEIMGVRHRELPIEGVQFHPESILTEGGLTIVKNFVDQCRAAKARR
mgnify:FL=1